MTLAFAATATIGSLRYDSHLTSLRIALGLAPAAGSATMQLPPAVRVEAGIDDQVDVSLRGEADAVPVFGGVVKRIDYGIDHVAIVATDALGQLAAVRPGQTYEQQSAGKVIRAFGAEGGVQLGAIEDGPDLLSYVADQGRTALEHTARLAAWSGAYAVGETDGSLAVNALPAGSGAAGGLAALAGLASSGGPADLALRYGREITALQIRDGAARPDTVWAGSGPAANVAAPNAHLQTTSALPKDAPAPAARTLRRAAPALRTPAAANDASAATAARNVTQRVSISCWLQPSIRPGMLVEIAGAPQAAAAGPWFITSVIHQLGPGPSGSTRLCGERLNAASSPLASAIGALGGLL